MFVVLKGLVRHKVRKNCQEQFLTFAPFANGPDKFDGIEFEQPMRLARRVEHTMCGITVRAGKARIIPFRETNATVII